MELDWRLAVQASTGDGRPVDGTERPYQGPAPLGPGVGGGGSDVTVQHRIDTTDDDKADELAVHLGNELSAIAPVPKRDQEQLIAFSWL